VTQRATGLWHTALLALLLVVWGNAKAYWDLVLLGTTAAGGPFAAAAGVLLVLLLSIVARALRLTWPELGLERARLRASVGLGVQVGGLLVVTAALGLFAIGLLGHVELSPAARMSWAELAVRCLLWLPLDTAAPEEFAFRGVLLGVMLRALGTAPLPANAGTGGLWSELLAVTRGMRHPAVWLSALPFAAWHVVVVQQDGPQPALVIAAKLVGIFGGGLLFGSLRLRAGHLAAPLIAHWTFDTAAFTAARILAGF
jgi:membrane protease YdiL (CAAX protease family)